MSWFMRIARTLRDNAIAETGCSRQLDSFRQTRNLERQTLNAERLTGKD